MIKARPLAGDIAAGADFPEGTAPLCLAQRYMDFRGHSRTSIFDQAPDPCAQGPMATSPVRGQQRQAGGAAGIREIEFLRPDPATDRRRALRRRCGAARRWPCWPNSPRRAGSRRRRARHSGRSTGSCATVEHALQMVADEQTHVLPEDDEGLERIALHAAVCLGGRVC